MKKEFKLGRSIELDAATPPKEFKLFTAGRVDTLKGVFTFDDVAVASVKAAAADWANRYPVDYAHAMLDPFPVDPAKANRSAGSFLLEVRDGELWAVDVQWTGEAAAMLADKQYRYVSPAFSTDADGRIVEFINVALTNLPATKGLDPLMASRFARDARTTLSGSLSFDAVGRAVREALCEKFDVDMDEGPSDLWIQEIYDDRVIFERAGKLWQITYGIEGTKAILAGEPVEVVRTYAPAPAAAKAAAKETPMDKKQICALLGLPEDTTDEKVLEAIAAMKPKEEPAAEPALPPEAAAKLARAKETETKLAKDLATAVTELATFKRTKLVEAATTEAASFKHLSQDPKVLGPILVELDEKAPESAKAIRQMLTGAEAALSKSKLFVELGKGGDLGGSGKTAYEQLSEKATAMVAAAGAKGEKLTREQALDQLSRTEPTLIAQYNKERGEKAAPAA